MRGHSVSMEPSPVVRLRGVSGEECLVINWHWQEHNIHEAKYEDKQSTAGRSVCPLYVNLYVLQGTQAWQCKNFKAPL